ncbi:hypothetical protein [Salmonella enterica]|nr:hypothetical protein [Salmonella enterica]
MTSAPALTRVIRWYRNCANCCWQVSTARRLLNNNAWISVAGRHFPRGSP